MIEIAGRPIAAGDPQLLGAAALLALLVLLTLLVMAVRRAGRSAALAEPVARHVARLNERVAALSDGQQQLAGALGGVAEAQAASQTSTLRLMEARLAEVSRGMGENLQTASTRTARSLGELQQRLEAIDRAQAKIEKLSGDVLGLQDILSNKQTRGAFGEIQLREIVAQALPAGSFTWQATLSTGARPDCLIHLPEPPGPMVVDAKFPLEAYEALRAADGKAARDRAAQSMRTAVRAHVRAIAEKYVIEGETADGALMFVPSEAVYAELHANFGEIVREGFAARVFLVSPTTLMATLNTLRGVMKDVRMREQAGAIRRELGLLHADLGRLSDRVGNLDRHFAQAQKDVSDIVISAEKAGRRAGKLQDFEFEGSGGARELSESTA